MGFQGNLYSSPGYTGSVGGGGGGSDIDAAPILLEVAPQWGGEGATLAYQKKMDGLVYLSGQIYPQDDWEDEFLIATLPEGRRPAAYFEAIVYDGIYGKLGVVISPDGTIEGNLAEGLFPYGDFSGLSFTPA